MAKRSSRPPMIRLRGVRQNNLKNIDLDLPVGKLIVFTGLSGSGKSSLAFETLFAEGQRRYIETFSPYARQFFDRMDKPKVDRVEGIPPAIAIEQRNAVRTTRSTVGTMTEICDYMKVLWPHVATLFCRGCGQPVCKDNPRSIWDELAGSADAEALITFDLPISDKMTPAEQLALLSKQGYQRILLDEPTRIEEAEPLITKRRLKSITVIQDRLKISSSNRSRFCDGCEQAFHFGKGKLAIHFFTDAPFAISRTCQFSNRYHCAKCDIDYREPVSALFSFNHPIGACPACKGFGRIITIDYNLAIPDRAKSLADGAVKPWQTGQGAESQSDLRKICRGRGIPMDVPFEKLEKKWQDLVVEGDPNYGKDWHHEWPRAWYGVKGYFRWLESKSYKMHVRVLLARYRAYSPCPQCEGKRFQPESLLFQVPSPGGKRFTLADFYSITVDEALEFLRSLSRPGGSNSDPVNLSMGEVRSRLEYLSRVGLGYLTLDRTTRSLSGGETERVNLTTCLGTRLVNTLYVLDEPSVGLHPRDTQRLVQVLEDLRDLGNTVVVVEHEPSVMQAADHVVDLGPGHGESGGNIVFQGPYKELLQQPASLTGLYLSGRNKIETYEPRPVPQGHPHLSIIGANCHNLVNLNAAIPLNRFVCLTGVSGSGKTTLAREVILPLLENLVRKEPENVSTEESETETEETDRDCAALARLDGYSALGGVVLVDQSALGRTPRSNPAVYIGAFEHIRELLAQTELAAQRGLNASAFSFNSSQGQCERCRGAGYEKIEMQFLSDVFVRCPECDGRRYRPHILEVKLRATVAGISTVDWSIADLLDADVDVAIQVMLCHFDKPAARRASSGLKVLQEVGLGYLKLGQPINTLSGGESQRLKLVSHLAEFERKADVKTKPTLFVFDEPTTGLHFEDIRILVKAFQKLVDRGHSLLVIEHNLEVIRCADWVIDLGPEAGAGGGRIVVEGPPAVVAECEESHTGNALQGRLPSALNLPKSGLRKAAA